MTRNTLLKRILVALEKIYDKQQTTTNGYIPEAQVLKAIAEVLEDEAEKMA